MLDVRAGLFTWDSQTATLRLTDAIGFGSDEVEAAQAELVFRIGEERGIVGLVAGTGEALYMPDCAADARWLGSGERIRSAYFLPVRDSDGSPRVVVLLSPSVDGIPSDQRQVALLVTRFLGWNRGPCRVEKRAQHLEESLSRISVVLDNLGIGGELSRRRIPEQLLSRIESLSPREDEVFRRLSRGDRVSTISRELFISPNTVRNHLKAIFRKLDVRSQAELLELVRPEITDRRS